MIAAITAPVLRIVRSYRRPFLWVMCISFIVLAVAAFALPKQLMIVRSAIDVGSVMTGEKPDPIEPLDQTLRRVTKIIGPKALSELAKKGTPASTIAALNTSEIENIGLSIVVLSTIDARYENETKEYQQSIADQIIRDQMPRVRALRETVAERIASAQRSTKTIDQLIDADAKEIERIDAFNENLQNRIDRARTDLTKPNPDTGPLNESAAIDALLHRGELISRQMAIIINLTTERSSLTHDIAAQRARYDEQLKLLAQAQLEATTVTEPSVSLPPLSMPEAAGSRRLRLLFLAFVSSILLAFGAVALLYNLAESKN